MTTEPLPNAVRQFIARYIQSVEQLEILCLLVENPARSWQKGEVYSRILSSEESVATNLQYFAAEGLLNFTAAGFQFVNQTTESGQLAIELARMYRARRVAIVEAIYQAPLDPIRHFADAFRIRKDKT